MIKEAYAQCNVEYLLKLFESYVQIKDDQEIFYIGGRLIQSNEEGLNKATYIRIFDIFYDIFLKHRNSLRQLVALEQMEANNNKMKHKSFIEEYKVKLCADLSQTLTRLINDIKKGIRNSENKNKEIEAFLQLNLADYRRYLCEVTLDKKIKEELMKETDDAFQKYFKLCTNANVNVVSPPVLTGHYHYAMFMFEVKEERKNAIKYLKKERLTFIHYLDTAFKNYLETYKLLDIITDTLTNWVILTGFSELKD